MPDYENIFNSLVKDYGERLFWHIRGIVNSHDAADDILQDVYLKAWQALPGFRGESCGFTWLWKIATNESVNYLRKEKLRSYLSLDARMADRGPSSDPYFDGDAAQAKLESAIASLPPKQKAVFCMRYYEELPYEEIALITGTSEGALKASYHLAQEKIKLFIERNV